MCALHALSLRLGSLNHSRRFFPTIMGLVRKVLYVSRKSSMKVGSTTECSSTRCMVSRSVVPWKRAREGDKLRPFKMLTISSVRQGKQRRRHIRRAEITHRLRQTPITRNRNWNFKINDVSHPTSETDHHMIDPVSQYPKITPDLKFSCLYQFFFF